MINDTKAAAEIRQRVHERSSKRKKHRQQTMPWDNMLSPDSNEFPKRRTSATNKENNTVVNCTSSSLKPNDLPPIAKAIRSTRAKRKLSNAFPHTVSSAALLPPPPPTAAAAAAAAAASSAATVPLTLPQTHNKKTKKKKLPPATAIQQALHNAVQSMSQLANDVKEKPYLMAVVADVTFRVAQNVLNSQSLSLSSTLTSNYGNDGRNISTITNIDSSCLKNGAGGWGTVLTFLSVGDGAALAATCEDMETVFQSPTVWKSLLQEHFKCDLSTTTSVVPRFILQQRRFEKPLYQVLQKDVQSELLAILAKKAASTGSGANLGTIMVQHHLDRAYYYVSDCTIFGKARADAYFRRVLQVSTSFPYLPRTQDGEVSVFFSCW